MNSTQRGITALLKSAVTQQPQPLPEDFDLAAAELLIRKHHLISMAYAGAVRCGVSGALPVMRSLFQGYCKAVQISERQMAQVKSVCSAFEENGIEYMPLKGCRLKAMYPSPELRMMGDADILIRMEQYEKIRSVLEGLGFSEENETDHELIWRSSGLYLELHKHLIPSYNNDFYAYFGDGWQLSAKTEGCMHSMTPENEWIYLFTHFAKHFRDGGIGCRHVADLWVYRRANPDMDECYIRRELEKLQLREFYDNTCGLLAFWFDDAAADAAVEFMTAYIFASGSWGAMETRVVSRVLRDTEGSAGTIRGKIAYLRQTAFPPLQMLRGKYKILRNHPWMLPVVWLIRPFYKILFERNTLEQRRRELEIIRVKQMEEQRQALQKVGLKRK